MNWLRAVLAELLGLFVDDGVFAAAIIGWIVACAVISPRIGLPGGVAAALLFAGMVVILIESAARRARGPGGK